ncbi:hypothetical protein FHX42_001862 [Saccharopolyspora lacisalsi]|uniref:YbaB/EbfC DNA-binding family protein n=1 Tax=Halosaccharopolyspora lacisalsi TaxID=1000566 RepID=A0A839DYR4_9PSEU|nr:hypothetical protein [Halosaccharopolyspora lacisalsi]MBA8824515.1 hypothetical protein [Halosaccharopolyspora lacisalsi]
MSTDERSVDGLIRIAEDIPETTDFAAGMDAIRNTARGEGIALSVDLQGKLVDLTLDDRALALGPHRLAAEISRLSDEASTRSLQQGMRAITTECGERIAEAIGAYVSTDDSDQRGSGQEPGSARDDEGFDATGPTMEPLSSPRRGPWQHSGWDQRG